MANQPKVYAEIEAEKRDRSGFSYPARVTRESAHRVKLTGHTARGDMVRVEMMPDGRIDVRIERGPASDTRVIFSHSFLPERADAQG